MTALDDRIAEARTHKALALAEACRSEGLTADAVLHSEDARRRAEKVARARKGSDDTWRQVVGMLAGSSLYPCPWCLIGDPEGPPGPPKYFGHSGLCSR